MGTHINGITVLTHLVYAFILSLVFRLFCPHNLLQLPLFSQACKSVGDEQQGEKVTANNLDGPLVGSKNIF